jgi:hypothetical protein
MKRSTLAAVALLAFGCALEKPHFDGGATPGSGGGTATGGTGGGTAGSGGTVGQGGSGGGGSGGGGSGGATGGSGGAGGTGGTMPRDAGGTGGTGGRDASMGSVDMAPPGMGGMGGGPIAGNLCSNGDCTGVIGMLDGFFIDESCGSGRIGPDCVAQWCNGRGAKKEQMFKLTGAASDASKRFEVTLDIKGVQECKEMSGGMRRTTQMQPPEGDQDMLWIGGNPAGVDYTANPPTGSPWNTQELHVDPPVAGEANNYFMNSCASRNAGGRGESHFTYKVNYQAKIKVMGGGTILWRMVDTNCRMIVNCGTEDANAGGACAGAHTVSLVGAVPAPPAALANQPLRNTMGAKGQFLFIDVVSVTAL